MSPPRGTLPAHARPCAAAAIGSRASAEASRAEPSPGSRRSRSAAIAMSFLL